MDTNIKIKKLQQKIRDLRKVHKLSGTEMAKDMNEKYKKLKQKAFQIKSNVKNPENVEKLFMKIVMELQK